MLVALVTPAILLVAGVLVFGPSGQLLFGIPMIYLWVFIMCPLTSGLMYMSWRLWDKNAAYDDEFEVGE